MTDQEMLDTIDAEIARVEASSRNYVFGLRFARALIVKRMEARKEIGIEATEGGGP